MLLVDNAHGAYLKFLPESTHPIDLGADICCDSAHKTLPVLTGGAYLHISDNVCSEISNCAKNSLALFGSTSPSYLILQSLDALNSYLKGYKDKLWCFIEKVNSLKARLTQRGYLLYGDEYIKITINTKEYGYLGCDFADILLKNNIVCEFSDSDYVVMMLTPENGDEDLMILERVLLSIEKRSAIINKSPIFHKPKRALSMRDAMFSLSEQIPVDDCEGRVAAISNVGCPPAVPIVVSGEIIDKEIIACFKYFGIDKCNVVI